jgi:hypothetical protein
MTAAVGWQDVAAALLAAFAVAFALWLRRRRGSGCANCPGGSARHSPRRSPRRS